jgi:hypothetical protein
MRARLQSLGAELAGTARTAQKNCLKWRALADETCGWRPNGTAWPPACRNCKGRGTSGSACGKNLQAAARSLSDAVGAVCRRGGISRRGGRRPHGQGAPGEGRRVGGGFQGGVRRARRVPGGIVSGADREKMLGAQLAARRAEEEARAEAFPGRFWTRASRGRGGLTARRRSRRNGRTSCAGWSGARPGRVPP